MFCIIIAVVLTGGLAAVVGSMVKDPITRARCLGALVGALSAFILLYVRYSH